MGSPETTTATAVLDPPAGEDPAEIIDAAHVPTDPATTAGGEELLTPGGWPTVEAVRIDPAELVIGENVRKTFLLDDYPEDKESIREFGVLVPICAERQPDGSLHVWEGQIRTLIALEVGIEKVPVWVSVRDTTVPDNEHRIRTMLRQLNANHRRIPMTRADDAAAVALMLDLGASVTRVAKGLQRKRSRVKAQAAIGKSPTAQRMLDDGYSLEHLQLIADYENLGDTDAVARLETEPSWRVSMTAHRIAVERATERARLQASLLYGALGFGVLTGEPSTAGVAPEFIPPELLETDTGDAVTEDTIYGDAERWLVYVDVDEDADIVDRETGELVDPDSVDWNTSDDSELEPAQGMRHADSVERRDRWTPIYFMPADQLDGSGLRMRPFEPVDGALLDHATDAAADREAARIARRRVRKLNERGLAAKERREKAVAELLRAAAPPPQAAAFVARALVRDHQLLSRCHAQPTARELLGIRNSVTGLTDAAEQSTADRAWVIVLGLVLGALESRIDKTLWRYKSTAVQDYLRFLAGLDEPLTYHLDEVEQAAAGLLDADSIDIDAA
ncbi:hypothetical protein NDR87_13695 [Nocardia sp. CDC159]|uniref:ParB family chromosome partitioning protein n=1 Tax=Nocardia pulmonis TaxID=2951408 RepID=A0A9X2E5B9_9NOCA|nr:MULTISPECIES: hypothetical protein [Nocardia]MCM6774524.1 hypothetical protein [Nocardia pulmonis]MCM6787410.1 hypothetical protein [Nocardia sp. CDC159]